MSSLDVPWNSYVLIIPDGAGDTGDGQGVTSLQAAALPWMDRLAADGVCGRCQTLFPDLDKGSLVAQLGMLGWDPYRYSPGGRASCELLALQGVEIGPRDLAFRANLVRLNLGRLESYNADYIKTDRARVLIERVQSAAHGEFPEFELYHNRDFRNTLIVRGPGIDPAEIFCPEPHEIEGEAVDVQRLVQGSGQRTQAFVRRLHAYLGSVHRMLQHEPANFLFPWSAARAFTLPSFARHSGFVGRAAVVGCMDFLQGIAQAGGLEFFPVGSGRPDTDFRGKGERVLKLLEQGYDFVVCHINAPDEAAHMGDRALKIRSLESIDRWVVGPIYQYFEKHPERLGGIMIVPDHFTNVEVSGENGGRQEAHSLHPVPFALCDGRRRDAVQTFDETAVLDGTYRQPLDSQDLLPLLGISSSTPAVTESSDTPRFQGSK